MSISLNKGLGRMAAGFSTGGLSELYQLSRNKNQFNPNLGVRLDPVQQLRDAPRGQFEQLLMNQAQGSGLTDLRRSQLQDQLGGIASGAQAQANRGISQLAQTGGVSAGARERLLQGSNIQSMLAQQRARQAAAEGSISDRLGLQKAFAQQESGERAADINALNARQRLLGQLDASQRIGQAQLAMANKPDILNRLSLGIL